MGIVPDLPAGVQLIPWSQFFLNPGHYTLLSWNPAKDCYEPCDVASDEPGAPQLAIVALAAAPRAVRRSRGEKLRWHQPDFETV